MKALFFWLVLPSIWCAPVIDVEKTVEQVQTILRGNSVLPRLTRDEILELLNAIRAEDAKTASPNTAKHKIHTSVSPKTKNTKSKQKNSRNPTTKHNVITKTTDLSTPIFVEEKVESTTKKSGNTMTVVLPYTPRDGSSLQELYTRPPRIEVIAMTESTPKQNSLRNTQTSTKHKNNDFTPELTKFLNSHGLDSNPLQDNFLLPLEGFKPLPVPKKIDDSVELPKDLILTYELVSDTNNKQKSKTSALNDALFEPLKPQFPFELESAASETEQSVLPLDLPKSRKTKAVNDNLNSELESIKVIPLGESLVTEDPDETSVIGGNFDKRQVSNETAPLETTTTESSTSVASEDTKKAESSDAIVSDTGASISDLEDSFGGAAPTEPGDSELPPPRKNGFYWMLDWNSFLEVGDGDTKVNIRLEPKLGDPQMFLPITVP